MTDAEIGAQVDRLLLGRSPGVELLGHMVSFNKLTNFFKVAMPVYILSRNIQGFQFSPHTYQHLVLSFFLIITVLAGSGGIKNSV